MRQTNANTPRVTSPDLNRPLGEADFVVVDIETTGLAPPGARITELAAVRVRRGEVDLEFSQLVDPGCAIPPKITEITGITTAMVRGQPRIEDVWSHFLSFLGGQVLVAHNARFDLSFLDCEAERLSGQPLPHPELCTVALSRRAWPALERHTLDSVAAHLDLRFRERHRALGDACVTAQVLLESFPYLAQSGIHTLGKALRAQRSTRCRARLAALQECA